MFETWCLDGESPALFAYQVHGHLFPVYMDRFTWIMRHDDNFERKGLNPLRVTMAQEIDQELFTGTFMRNSQLIHEMIVCEL